MDSSIIEKYFLELSPAQKSQFQALGALYAHWNEKINVVSRKDIDDLYERHVLHSLGIAKFATFALGTKLLDVGTGGGFPGIPLAILFPQAQFHLVDSIGKKISVVQEIAAAIGLTNVTATHTRMEKIKGPYDFILSRAVAPAKQLYQWTHHCLGKTTENELSVGWIFLKGGDLKKELKEGRKHYQLTSLADYFEEEFFETKHVVYIPG